MNLHEQKIFTESLLNWFSKSARVLPWREDPLPYKVWISEIMLQQTRVAAVMPYFERFMEKLPKVSDLACVEEDKLLKLWEGLGYYNRARNLQKAAQVIMEKHGGVIPKEYEELIQLPGIGPYTAGAIASIAYGKKRSAIDGNVYRVFTRILAEDGDITKGDTKERIEKVVMQCMPDDACGAYNQALMELGAVICLPNGQPLCDKCPVSRQCKAYAMKTQLSYPVKPEKATRKIEKKTILVIQDANKLAIRKRPPKGLLASLYEFPNLEGHCSGEEALEAVKKMGWNPLSIKELGTSKHIFTHKEWHMIGYAIRVDELVKRRDNEEKVILIEPDETRERYPIPSAYSAYTEHFDIHLGNSNYDRKE